MRSSFYLALVLALFAACQKEVPSPQKRLPVLPDQPFSYNIPPTNSFFNPFGDSIIDNDVATLGRVLFYDTQLSHNNSVSCGSCHRQIDGFADPKNFSIGFENGLTARNTQTIVNTGTQTGFFGICERVPLIIWCCSPLPIMWKWGLRILSNWRAE